jgi:hypothetical protein
MSQTKRAGGILQKPSKEVPTNCSKWNHELYSDLPSYFWKILVVHVDLMRIELDFLFAFYFLAPCNEIEQCSDLPQNWHSDHSPNDGSQIERYSEPW